MKKPRDYVERIEAAPELPAGSQERFRGYGVMGLPFLSGHVLAMRRFPASSVGPAYTSVWHRSPAGVWTFYADTGPRLSCTRYFGAAATHSIETGIHVSWRDGSRFSVQVAVARLEWDVEIASTLATRAMTGLGHLLAERAWHNPAMLTAMGKVAGVVLGAGRVRLWGSVPNGQGYIANPRVLWAVSESRASLAGEDLGSPGPVSPQARLGDFWIPQRGVFAIGGSFFDEFDPDRHSLETEGARPA